jgi:hypothetical protein
MKGLAVLVMVNFRLWAQGFAACPFCGVFGAGLLTLKAQGQARGTAMKVNIEMDMTPQEARAFMGLPDVAPLQQKMLDDVQARMRAAFDANDPEAMMKAWTPLGGVEAFQRFQKMMWDQAAAMGQKPGK